MTLTNSVQRAYFIGVGGIGMSGLARLFLHEGTEVYGSDRSESVLTGSLEKEGVSIAYTQDGEFLKEVKPDLVIYTEAMPPDHPEMLSARASGVVMMNYFEALATITNQYYLIAVAGTHGKTTTTAMLIDIFEEAGYDPTAIVGSLRTKTGSNFRAGAGKYFIVEADEYKENFKYLEPDLLLITNLDHEHVDYYPTIEDVQRAFRTLALKVPDTGAIVTQPKDAHVIPVVDGLVAPILDYKQNIDLRLKLTQPGLHNRLNAAAAKTVARFVGIEDNVIDSALTKFAGTWRRFEYKGEVNGAPVYDDYAHNPQKISAALAGARELYPDREIVVVFQPHTYSRTRELYDGFVGALKTADTVLLLPIYAAREEDDGTVSSQMLVKSLTKEGVSTFYMPDFDSAVAHVTEHANATQVVLVVGAGDITKVSNALIV